MNARPTLTIQYVHLVLQVLEELFPARMVRFEVTLSPHGPIHLLVLRDAYDRQAPDLVYQFSYHDHWVDPAQVVAFCHGICHSLVKEAWKEADRLTRDRKIDDATKVFQKALNRSELKI